MNAMEAKKLCLRKYTDSLVKACSIVTLCLSFSIFAQDATEESQATNTAAETQTSGAMPEEITITGRKLFRTLERQIREAEDHMYSLFNDLNDDDYYDITCQWEKPLGTRVRQRVCRPTFVVISSGQEAVYFHSQVTGSGLGVHAPSAQSTATHHYPILADKLKEVLTENEEFLDAVIEHHELREELREKKSSFFGIEKDQ